MFFYFIRNLICFLAFMISIIFFIRNINKENYIGCLFYGVVAVFCVAAILIMWCFQN